MHNYLLYPYSIIKYKNDIGDISLNYVTPMNHHYFIIVRTNGILSAYLDVMTWPLISYNFRLFLIFLDERCMILCLCFGELPAFVLPELAKRR